MATETSEGISLSVCSLQLYKSTQDLTSTEDT